MTPPRLARALLRMLTPARERALIDELADEFDRIARTDDAGAARRWYWRQTLGSALPLARARLALSVERAGPPRHLFSGWYEDGRQALRWVHRHPGLSAAVIGTLGAAAAATLAAIVVAETAVLDPLRDRKPGEIVAAWTTGPARPQSFGAVPWPDFVDLRRDAKTFSALCAYSQESVRFTGHGEPRELQVARVSEGFESLLPAPLALGRPFNDEDFTQDPPRVAILQHRFWLREFGGDPQVVGRTITLDERAVEIVGVLPPTRLPLPLDSHDAWIPLVASRGVFWQVSRGTGWLSMIGRLQPGRTPAEGQAELTSIAARLAVAFPNTNREVTMARVERVADRVAGPIAPMLALLGAGLGAVLIIAAGNVANLLLSSASARRREFAVRQAIGASSTRIARQLFLEALLLCGAACALGMAAATPLARAFAAMYPGVLADAHLALTPVTVAAAAILAIALAAVLTATGVLSTARRLTLGTGRATPADTLVRHALVALQVALSLLLVVGCVALVRTVGRLAAIDPGFDVPGVLTFKVTPSGERFASGAAAIGAYDRMLRNIEQVPGVRSAAAATAMPLTTGGWMFGIRPPGSASDVRVMVNLASPRYLETLGIPLLGGRMFSDADARSNEAIAIVNEPLARIVAGDRSLVGTTFPYSGRTWRIIGIVGGTRGLNPREPAMPELFLPWAIAGRRPQAIAVRADGDVLRLLPAIARLVHDIDPTAPLADVATLEDRLARAIRAETFRAALIATLAALAVGLAAIGAYSVTAFAVARRRREYAVRLALGERPRSILWRAARDAALPACYGTIAGLAGSLAAARSIAPFTYGIEVADQRVLSAAAALMLILALGASLGSARQAARSDPATALRVE